MEFHLFCNLYVKGFPTNKIRANMQKAIFHNHAKIIASHLRGSNRSIDIAMCWFSNPVLFEILLKKAEAGIPIRLLLQYDQANFHSKGLKFLELIRQGGEVLVFYKAGVLFHHKFAIIDANKLITGSYNWTQARNKDNLIITDEQELLIAYKNTFESWRQKLEPLPNLKKIPPPAPPFDKLFEPILWSPYDLRHAILWGAKVWLSVFSEKEMKIWEDCLQQQRHFLKIKADYFEQYKGVWNEATFINWSLDQPITKQRLLKNYCQRVKAKDVLVTITDEGILLGAGLIGIMPEAGYSENYAFARYVQWFEFPKRMNLVGQRVPRLVFTAYRGSGLRLIDGLFESRAA